MSKLYRGKPPKEKHRCIDCEHFDIIDMWCLRRSKDISDPYLEIVCGVFLKAKGPSKSRPAAEVFLGLEIRSSKGLKPDEGLLVASDAVNRDDGELNPSKVVIIKGLEEAEK